MRHQFFGFHRLSFCLLIIFSFTFLTLCAQKKTNIIDVSGFRDSEYHWKDITDHEQVIVPNKDQQSYQPAEVREIANNILLYQQPNGGWPKNYDMLAMLTDAQKQVLRKHKDSNRTTFDNGATYSQVEYLVKAYSKTSDSEYKKAALRGINFMLDAQYNNGGWPQFYPDVKGYRKYITFNDGAMIGVMTVLHHIVQNDSYYSFVDVATRKKVAQAFAKGIDCILKCQIIENGQLTVWCQQHDNIDFSPRNARTFELASKASEESTQIIELLMSIDLPGPEIINAVKSAVSWFKQVEIKGIIIKTITDTEEVYKFHATNLDKIVMQDSSAKPIWTRYYELETNRSFFANRDGKKVYQLADVSRERRTGYAWYGYWPQKMLNVEYPGWIKNVETKN